MVQQHTPQIIATIVIIVAETIVRLYPTKRNYSLLDLGKRIVDFIIPNRMKKD
jgi:hypothetical protein